MSNLYTPPNLKPEISALATQLTNAANSITADTTELLTSAGIVRRTFRPLTELARISDKASTGWTLANNAVLSGGVVTLPNAGGAGHASISAGINIAGQSRGATLVWSVQPFTSIVVDFYLKLAGVFDTESFSWWGLGNSVTNNTSALTQGVGFSIEADDKFSAFVVNTTTGAKEVQALTGTIVETNINKFTIRYTPATPAVAMSFNDVVKGSFVTAVNIPTTLDYVAALRTSTGSGVSILIHGIEMYYE